jgi:hypothetical protein
MGRSRYAAGHDRERELKASRGMTWIVSVELVSRTTLKVRMTEMELAAPG